MDVPLAWLYEQLQRLVYKPYYTPTSLQLADLNTKPHGGTTLKNMVLPLIGFNNYPSSTSKHFELLDLRKYHVTLDRVS